MNDIDKYVQKELIRQNEELFFIILYGCAGVIFQKHFFQLLGSRNEALLNRMIENKLVKTKKAGKNKVVILKYAVYCFFKQSNKTAKLSTTKLLQSALLCEMFLHQYEGQINAKIVSTLLTSNYIYYFPQASLNVLTRIHRLSNAHDTSSLEYAIGEHEEKVRFIKSSSKGRTETLKAKAYKSDDLFTLRSNDIYINSVYDLQGKVAIRVSIFVTNKTAEKIISAITKTEIALSEMLYGINIKIFYDIYSLNERLKTIENKVYAGLLKIKGNELKEELYLHTIRFYWYGCKNRLFSGIDINKWL